MGAIMNIPHDHGFDRAKEGEHQGAADDRTPAQLVCTADAPSRKRKCISIIDNRSLERFCLVQCLEQMSGGIPVIGYESIEAWQAEAENGSDGHVILFNPGTRPSQGSSVREDLIRLVKVSAPRPVILLGQSNDLESIVAALDCGAVGYLLPDNHLEDLLEGACAAAAGNLLLPRSSLNQLRELIDARPAPRNGIEAQFTDRQLAVARALQRGAANKTIAYELNLCESTVKVHIRKIMRALNATNRTQAAFKLNTMSLGSTSNRG
jgi:DNA-binding NarL/FixJ family response regulator